MIFVAIDYGPRPRRLLCHRVDQFLLIQKKNSSRFLSDHFLSTKLIKLKEERIGIWKLYEGESLTYWIGDASLRIDVRDYRLFIILFCV